MKLFLELDLVTLQLRVIPPPSWRLTEQPEASSRVTFDEEEPHPQAFNLKGRVRRVRCERVSKCRVELDVELNMAGHL
jgi:hypothetical protein